MEQVKIFSCDNKTTISLFGRIDSSFVQTNSEQIEKAIVKGADIVFDFENVEYISSAGLRLILKTAKEVKSTEVINVNNEVYEVFEISGFTQIIKVKKALRVLSVEGKEIIGEGANGKVYRYDIDTIIKVYKDSSKLGDIENEISMSKKAFMLGVPTAIPFDIVRIKEGGYGCVYELLKSEVLSSLFAKNPENFDEYCKLFVDAVSKFMHTTTDDDTLPKKIDYARSWISFYKEKHLFSNDVILKIENLFKTIEKGNTLIHGDFHIKNIMIQNNEAIIIDMDTLGVGHPIFEIGYSYYSMVEYDKYCPEKSLEFFGVNYEIVTKVFFETFNLIFKDKTKEEKEEILEKLRLFANLRIVYKALHRVPGDPELGNLAVKYVEEHIYKVKSLDFSL